MRNDVNHRRNVKVIRAFSLLVFGLAAISLLLVHATFYEPAVTYLLLYLTVAGSVTVAGMLLFLPAELFTNEFAVGAYATYAALFGMMVFFTGGVSSELYVLYFALLLASALHGVRWIGVLVSVSALLAYFLAVTPDLVAGETGGAGLALFRLGALALVGGFVAATASGSLEATNRVDYATDEDGSMLLEVVEGEISASRGEHVAVILVDPGRGVGDPERLLERVRGRIAEPILLGQGSVFGMVLRGVDERSVESAAGRALAAAGSLGAKHSLAGAAIYPRDARSAGDLLSAAGRALEAAFEPEAPGVMLAGRTPQNHYRAAR